MLDFSVPHSASADDIATEVATTLTIGGGYLLRSGTSYDLLGDYLLTWEESTIVGPHTNSSIGIAHCASPTTHAPTHTLIASTRST